MAALGTKPSSPKSPALFPAGDVSATSSSDDSESETTESLVPVRVPKMKVAMYGPDKQTGSSPGEQTDEQDEALDDVEKLPQVPMDASEAEMEQQNESREATPEPREKTPEPREKTPEPQEEVPEQAENAPASPAGEVVIATIDLTGDSDEAMPTDEVSFVVILVGIPLFNILFIFEIFGVLKSVFSECGQVLGRSHAGGE